MVSVKKKVVVFLATWGLIGFSPIAPGSFGSLMALPLCLFVSVLPSVPAVISTVAFIIFSVYIANCAEKTIGTNDPKQVVIDEVCGMLITLFALPFTIESVIWGFALFRVFDILKPFPVGWADKKVYGGFGIVLDDIIAGALANTILRIWQP